MMDSEWISDGATTIEKLTIIISILAIVISITSVFLGQYLASNDTRQQEEKYQHNIAQALYFDLSNVEFKLISTMYVDVTQNMEGVNPSSVYALVISKEPYYSDNGLYYVFNKDIANFNNVTISADLYNCYFNITKLETDRSELNQLAIKYGNVNVNFYNSSLNPKISTADYRQIDLNNNDMIFKLTSTAQQIDRIKQELKTEYGVKGGTFGDFNSSNFPITDLEPQEVWYINTPYNIKFINNGKTAPPSVISCNGTLCGS